MIAFLIPFSVLPLIVTCNTLSYADARNQVIKAEDYLSLGGNLQLSPKEEQVDKILMKLKTKELVAGYNDESKLLAGKHFFKAKHLMEQSDVFKFLQLMPKGAQLHGHNSALVSSDWVIRNLTYYPGLMRCTNQAGVVILTFRSSDKHNCPKYIEVDVERRQSQNVPFYDSELEKLINLYTPQPEIVYASITKVWKKFQNMFTTVGDLINFMPAFKAYHWRLFEEMYEDGIFYAELRTSFPPCYDSSGKTYSSENVAQELIQLIAKFKIEHPNFLGVKIIYATNRNINQTELQNRFEAYKELFNKFPNFVIGFDLVGQEDLGKPLYNFVPILKQNPPGSKFFFHAGETNWYGASTDLNLLDAILLNTTRIGHGYSLIKHPVLCKAIKKQDIAIEISLISNQVLDLVWDLRNHPASFYVSENLPIIISNDDPGFWSAKGLSYDYYYALMSIGSSRAGLKFMKTLVWNSIKYSTLTFEENKKAMILLEKNWYTFLDKILSGTI